MSNIEILKKYAVNYQIAAVYCIIINFKKYIGSSHVGQSRLSEHLTDLKYNRHINSYLQNAYNKYGVESISICFLDVWNKIDEQDLRRIEGEWIKAYDSANRKYGYNIISDPVANGLVGVPRSEETKKKISQALRNSEYFKSGEASRRGIIAKNTGTKIFSEESKEKSRQTMRRKAKNGELSGENNPFYGKSHSDEMKLKLSNDRKGKNLGKDNPNFGNQWTDDQKMKMSERVKKQDFYMGSEYLIWDSENKKTYRTNDLSLFLDHFSLPIKVVTLRNIYFSKYRPYRNFILIDSFPTRISKHIGKYIDETSSYPCLSVN